MAKVVLCHFGDSYKIQILINTNTQKHIKKNVRLKIQVFVKHRNRTQKLIKAVLIADNDSNAFCFVSVHQLHPMKYDSTSSKAYLQIFKCKKNEITLRGGKFILLIFPFGLSQTCLRVIEGI